ncbi:hypothetical protein [Geoalkalibacter halelectricus]|uniref:hypothetical protein n=1 Tax=Geoalkalibacter halelectricus TaxID=2847045 RepID=UPI003D1957BD
MRFKDLANILRGVIPTGAAIFAQRCQAASDEIARQDTFLGSAAHAGDLQSRLGGLGVRREILDVDGVWCKIGLPLGEGFGVGARRW